VVAEIRGLLVALLFGGGLLAMLGVADVVFDAQLADMQLGIAGLADVEAAQRQRQCREGGTAVPADQGLGLG